MTNPLKKEDLEKIDEIKLEDLEKINKALEQDFVKVLLYKKIDDNIKQWLENKRVLITSVIAGVLALGAFLGWQIDSTWKEILEKQSKYIDNFEQKLLNLEKKASDSNEKLTNLIEKNQEQQNKYGKELKELSNESEDDIKERLKEASEKIEDTEREVGKVESKVSELAKNANDKLIEADKKLIEADKKIYQADSNLTKTDSKLSEVSALHDRAFDTNNGLNRKVDETTEKINKTVGEAQTLGGLTEKAKKLNEVQTRLLGDGINALIFMRSRKAAIVTLIDPKKPTDPNSDWTLTFSKFNIDGNVLTVFGKAQHENSEIPFEIKDLPTQSPIEPKPIGHGIPFRVQMNFVYHTKLSRDFVSLRITGEKIQTSEGTK